MIQDELIKLDDVAQPIFGLSLVIAKRKAAICALPVPAFRLTSTGRGQLFVTKESIENYVNSRITEASKLHKQLSLG